MKHMKNNNFIKRGFNSRTMKFGSYAFIVTIIALALLVGLNAVLGIERVRTALRFDITANRLFSIGEETKSVIGELTEDVEFVVLLSEEDFGSEMLKEIFKQYELHSDGRISVSYVDIDKDPQFVRRELDPEVVAGIGKGDLVVRSGSKVRRIDNSELQDTRFNRQTGETVTAGLLIEQAFTGAVLNVTSDYTPVVYFLTGHGELSVDGDLSTLMGTLNTNNYEVRTLTLTDAMPEDASAVVIANPSTDLLGSAAAILTSWLREDGGDLIVFADAKPEAEDMPNLNSVLEIYNLKLNNDVVMEGNRQNYIEQPNFIIPRVAANDITTELDPNAVMLLLPNSRSVEILQNTKEWIETFPIFQTSDQAYRLDSESGFRTPIPGSFLMGAASVSQGGSEESRMVVIGNASFVTNEGMAQTTENGKRYLLTIVNWMQDRADEIVIPPKDNSVPLLSMTEQSIFLTFISMTALLPILVIGSGVLVWFKRRHL